MTPDNDVDQDALAAQWEGALDTEDPEAAAAEAEANQLSEAMAEQWAAMVDDGGRKMPSGNTGGERVLSQEEIDNLLGFSDGEVSLDENSGIRAIIEFRDGLLRASSDARNRVRPPCAIDDYELAQFHF